MNIFIAILALVFLIWGCYQIQKQVGEEQTREWEQFRNNNPSLSRQPSRKGNDEQKKYIEEMWDRWNKPHHNYESGSHIRKEC